MTNHLKPVTASDDKQDIYEYCMYKNIPIREYGQIVFVPKHTERLAEPKAQKKTGWFKKLKAIIPKPIKQFINNIVDIDTTVDETPQSVLAVQVQS